MSETRRAVCELCGEPMPEGEEMFKFHGYSGPCPKPPLKSETPLKFMAAAHETLTFLDALADKLDRWAIAIAAAFQWLAPDADGAEMAANDCRRAAAKLRAAIIIEEHGDAS